MNLDSPPQMKRQCVVALRSCLPKGRTPFLLTSPAQNPRSRSSSTRVEVSWCHSTSWVVTLKNKKRGTLSVVGWI